MSVWRPCANLQICLLSHVLAREDSIVDTPPPLASTDANTPTPALAQPVRSPEHGLSKLFGSGSHCSSCFCLCFLLLPQVSAFASGFCFCLRIYLSFLILLEVFCASFDTYLRLSSQIRVVNLGFFRRLLYSCFQEVCFVPISLFGFPMSTSEDQKPVSAPEVVSMMSKITKDKLTGPNYLDWCKTVRLYLKSILMANHLNKDPHTDDSKG